MSLDREELLSTAADVLTRRPTSSMDDIAKAAGISRATLHRHFAGRDALVRALEQLGHQRLDAALDAARTQDGDAADAVRRVIAQVEPFAGFLAFLVTENQLFEPGEQHEGWTRIDERIGELFRRGQAEGTFRLDLTPAWLTDALYSLIASSAWAVQDGRIAAREAVFMTSELLLGGALRSKDR
ncbi:TetR/AcrR family transcriptional regulator [Streptomyces iconiensis]|uniref:Helix-turn-helix domain-containing protein n=1 Tax=Streptomyces iconiensis TaxID=1384038 RepID=A0ABT6ZUI3_9ACTN|nr:TetR/AcrR family transcriptional regulator [Streptomyces iconiensis]MDJ1132296.1 helix-turn-helix domain-containing protein [Streptomyces iconiensis]